MGILSKLKSYIITVILAGSLLFGLAWFIQDKKIESANIEISEWKTNALIMNGQHAVLKGKYDDIMNLNDSLILSLDSTRNALGIAKKDLKQATKLVLTFKDSLQFMVDRKPILDLPIFDNITQEDKLILEEELLYYCDFDTIHKSNQYTEYKISMHANEFKLTESIHSEMDIFIPERKVWRNPNKNFFQRLFTWDWKKDPVDDVEVVQYNELITTDKIKVIWFKD